MVTFKFHFQKRCGFQKTVQKILCDGFNIRMKEENGSRKDGAHVYKHTIRDFLSIFRSVLTQQITSTTSRNKNTPHVQTQEHPSGI